MAALFILAGLLFAVLGWLWMLKRAFLFRVLWGMACLLPPVALLFGLLHWRRNFLPLLVLLGALGALVTGLYQLRQTQPQHWQAVISGQWLNMNNTGNSSTRPGMQLDGVLSGKPFVAARADWKGSELRVQDDEGDGFRLTFQAMPASEEGLHAEILPDDRDPGVQLHAFWFDYSAGHMQHRHMVNDFTLRLDLRVEDALHLAGDFYLALDAGSNTLLSGSLLIENPLLEWREMPGVTHSQPEDEQDGEQDEPAEPALPPFSLEQLQSYPERYLHRQMHIKTLAGYRFTGRFQGHNAEGGLVFVRDMPKAGEVLFQLFADEVGEIELEEQ